jgi:hypothetical protein
MKETLLGTLCIIMILGISYLIGVFFTKGVLHSIEHFFTTKYSNLKTKQNDDKKEEK